MVKKLLFVMFIICISLKSYDGKTCEGYEMSIDDIYDNVINASSYLIEKNKSKDLYLPRKAIDNDKNTAWVEGKKGHGIGEFLIVDIGGMKVKYLNILPGFARNEKLFLSNNRPQKLRFVIFKLNFGDNVEEIKQEEVINKKTILFEWFHELNDVCEFQKITMPNYEKYLDMGIFLAIIIKSVYPGLQHQDTCISEIRFIDYEGKDILKEVYENWKFKHGVTK